MELCSILIVYGAFREFLTILWNPNLHYSVHKSPPLIPIPNEINPAHKLPPHFFMIHFNIIVPLTYNLHNIVCSSGIRTKILYGLLSYACCMPCLSYPPSLNPSNNVWGGAHIDCDRSNKHMNIVYVNTEWFEPCTGLQHVGCDTLTCYDSKGSAAKRMCSWIWLINQWINK